MFQKVVGCYNSKRAIAWNESLVKLFCQWARVWDWVPPLLITAFCRGRFELVGRCGQTTRTKPSHNNFHLEYISFFIAAEQLLYIPTLTTVYFISLELSYMILHFA